MLKKPNLKLFYREKKMPITLLHLYKTIPIVREND